MATKWTDPFIRNLKPKTTRYDLREGDGFTVRVSPNGTRTFYFLFTLRGHKRRMYLGEYDPKAGDPQGWETQEDPMPYHGLVSLKKARRRHTISLSLVEKKIDPVEQFEREEEEKRAQLAEEDARRVVEDLAPTVGTLCTDYVEKYAKPRKRSWKEDERQLNLDVVPALGNLKARDVTDDHIRALLRRKLDAGSPIAANRLLAVVRKMFAWAKDEGIVKQQNPCVGLRAPGKKVSKDRVLTPDEVCAVWALLEPPTPRTKEEADADEAPKVAMSSDVRRALRLILVTAQRPGEVAGMTWEEVEGSWWTIPAERAKNGLSHRVHLSKLALEVLGTRGDGYVFPSPRPKAGHIHINALAQAVRVNQKALGVTPFTPHDLRRTAASIMAGAGVAPFTVERVLNHTLQGVQAVYNRHSYDAEKREALNRWAGHLGRILAGKAEEKVVPIRAARSGSK